MSKRRLMFIHIPKCGGMSAHDAFVAHYGEDQSKLFFGREEGKGLWQVHYKHNHWEHEGAFLELKQVLLQGFLTGPYTYIGGHLPFSPLAQNYHKETTIFTTILRDPVERVYSSLKYLVFHFGKHPADAYNNGDADPLTEIEEWLKDASFVDTICNQLSIYLGGLNYQCQVELDAREKHAITSLELIDVIGFLDDLKEYEQALEAATGATFSFDRKNNADSYVLNQAVADRLEDFLKAKRSFFEGRSAADRRVYEKARALKQS